VADHATIAQLIEQLGLTGKRIAIEINETTVPRSAHATTVLRSGDRVEIVHAIGGG
jgi:sulfur carrier protein